MNERMREPIFFLETDGDRMKVYCDMGAAAVGLVLPNLCMEIQRGDYIEDDDDVLVSYVPGRPQLSEPIGLDAAANRIALFELDADDAYRIVPHDENDKIPALAERLNFEIDGCMNERLGMEEMKADGEVFSVSNIEAALRNAQRGGGKLDV